MAEHHRFQTKNDEQTSLDDFILVLCNSSALLPNIALLEMSVVMPLFFGNWGDLVTLVSLVNIVYQVMYKNRENIDFFEIPFF